ncbi:MAG: PEP-utilizing enzyme [Candidatus Woesearchaeota archaeon]
MDNVNWKKLVTRSLNLYKTDIYMVNLVRAYKKHFQFDFDNVLVHGKGYECAFYVGDKDMEGLGEVNKKYFLDCLKSKKDPFIFLDKLSDNYLLTTKDIFHRTLTTRVEVIKAYNDFINVLMDFMIIIWFPVMCEVSFFPYAQERLKKYITDEKAWDVIVEPFEPSVIQEEMISLLQSDSDEKLKEHKENFTWIGMRFVDNDPKDIDYFKKRLEEIKDPEKELRRINADLDKKKKRFSGLLDYLDVSEEDRKLFIYVNKSNQLRQTRDKTRRTAYYYVKHVFTKILELLKTNYAVLYDLTHNEVLDLLEREKTIGAKDFIHMFKHGELEIIRDNVEDRLKQENILSKETKETNEFKGTIACQGKVTGKVKVINLNSWAADVSAVEKGDILVAISTKPDYIVAMERANAFVTDEGGITCHAAIVAREMNKPCLVGTNVATQVLKDGDIVEVDADNGIIKRIG